MFTGTKMSSPSSPGRVASSSSTTGVTDANVKTCGATLTRKGVRAYQSSGTSCSTSEREREHPVRVGELIGAGSATLRNVKLTMAGRYADKVWG